MSGSVLGRNFVISTFGESHGKALGVVIDGCPAGLLLDEADIQTMLYRRRPGQSRVTTARLEADKVEILSGVFEGVTTGTPIALVVYNTDQHSKDYSEIRDKYRPGHADYPFDVKFAHRDYRGGGRSSGRETLSRVAAGAVAKKVLSELGIEFLTYTRSIADIEIADFDKNVIFSNALYMPDEAAAKKAEDLIESVRKENDSLGGVVEGIISGLPVGLGDPVFDKLDAELAKAIFSIGAVKGFEIGEGFNAARLRGSENNDGFEIKDGTVTKKTNHSGGTLGGMSDGSDLIFRAAFKPTPSISQAQQTVTASGEETEIAVKGRHDPVIVPRAVVVVEAMAAITVLDLLLCDTTSRMDKLRRLYER